MDANNRPSREELFHEYELCQNSVHNLESNIWKTSGAIGIGTLVPLLLLINKEPKPVVALILGFLVSSVTWIWWLMSKRWWHIQHVTFLRLRHIEKRLHIHQYRYMEYIEGKDQPKDSDLSESERDEVKYNPKIARSGVQKYLKLFPILITIVWILYIFWLFF